MPIKMLERFFKMESSGGVLICLAAFVAIIFKNSSLEHSYNLLLSLPVAIHIGEFSLNKPLLLWINDGLMTIFFGLVGLEIKREILEGQLSKYDQISLPVIAACGGVLFPALIYYYFNHGDAEALRGWAIPTATDIAFAIAALSLLGKRIPTSLRMCLLAIAIIDDLVAIAIIALFYTAHLSFLSLVLALIAVTIFVLLNRFRVQRLTPYVLTGFFLWVCVLKSGIHATMAGVVMAIFIPIEGKTNSSQSLLHHLERELHPWVAYGVLPIFAFANAGVSFKGLSLEMILNPITLGIALGLFLGKQIGVMFFTALGVTLRICKLPKEVTWSQYYGMALLTGIGFTMSLFVGSLAFTHTDHYAAVRLGVLVGSLLSALLGYGVLRYIRGSQ